MLRKHFIMSGDGKPDFTITYHAPKHVPFFGGYAKDWVYGWPSEATVMTDFNKFKVIGDEWNNGVGEWKFKLDDSSNRIYTGPILGNMEDGMSLLDIGKYGFGQADHYEKHIFEDDDITNIIESTIIDNSNIITSVIFGEGIETIDGSILYYPNQEKQSSCTAITLPETVTQLTGDLFNDYTSLKTITVPQNVVRIDNLCNIDGDSLEEVVLKPLTPPDASNTSKQAPLGVHSNNGENSSKIRVYADCIDVYKNDSIWGQYSDLYDTINNTIVYYNGEDRKLYTENQDITSINSGMLPQSITNVYLPNSVTSINQSAFEGCSGLTSVEIGNSVTIFGENVFSGCSELTSVVWNAVNCSDFSYYYSSPFYTNEESQITSFEFGDSVEHIPAYVCSNMYNLTSIEIPNSVTSIGECAFEGCSGLTSVVIPNSVTSIGPWAFSGCPGLTSITVDENNPKYDSRENCNAIIETETNTLIRGCKNTIIPNSVTSIGQSAFKWCTTGLTSIVIPNSVTIIEDSAFYNCTELTSIVIPNSVTSIGEETFYYCQGLTSVEIGNSVTSIGSNAFGYCTGLTQVTISSIIPPTLSSYVFNNTHSDLQIYVPDESVETYKNATNWSSYSSKIKPISEKPV